MKNFQENQRDVEAPQARDLERTKRLVSIWAELNRNIVYSLPSFLSPVNDRVNVALAMIEGSIHIWFPWLLRPVNRFQCR